MALSFSDMAAVGAKLREAREQRGLSLHEIAESTKVSIPVLQALERGDISKIPGGLYARGYVRSFASAVGLDPDRTVADFVAQFPSTSVTDGYPTAQPIVPEIVTPSRHVSIPWKAAALVLPVALLAYAGWQWIPERLDVPGVIPVLAAPAPDLFARALSTDRAPIAPGPHAIVAVAADIGQARPPEAEGVSVPAAPAQPIVRAAFSERDFAPESLAVVIAARRSTWVIATVDGRRVVNRLFHEADQQTIDARRDLIITAGDAGAIIMTLNGRMARPLGKSGQTVTAHVTSENFRDYLRR